MSVIETEENETVGSDDVDDETFSSHLNGVQAWFLKCSFKRKAAFMNLLFESLKNDETFHVIVNALNYHTEKLNVYTTSLQSTNYVYDKKLRDHNRAIVKHALGETITTNLTWYKKLDDAKQIQVIFQLLKLGGGALIKTVYDNASQIYYKRPKPPAVDVKTSGELEENTIFKDYLKSISYNLKDPLNLIVEKKRKMWTDTMNKYRVQVEGKPEMAGTKSSTKSKSAGSKSKNSKIGKSSKTSKSSKGGKKQNREDSAHLDQIQLLPVWVTKQIFSYLDNNTLKKAKAVNPYWNYVITDLLKEKGARKYINKAIEKMKADLKLDSEKFYNIIDRPVKNVHRISKVDKRVAKLAERGAIDRKLRPGNESKLYKSSLIAHVIQDAPDDFGSPLETLETFPRIVPRNDTLQKSPSCTLNEIGKTVTQRPTDGLVTIVERDVQVNNLGVCVPILKLLRCFNANITGWK